MPNNFSIILPTYNEAGNIIKLIKRLKVVFNRNREDFEIIVVDDNSNDDTAKIVSEYSIKNKFLKLYNRKNKKRNLAKSIELGIKKSNNNIIIWLDADLQHPPEYINQFIKNIKKYDVIIFSRYHKSKANKQKSFHDNSTSFLNKICNKILFKDFTDFTSGFICIKKYSLKKFTFNAYYGEYFIDLLSYIKFKKLKFLELPFKESERHSGYSKTTHNKINYVVKSFFYLVSILKNIILKIFKGLIKF
jgi:dolichol-phosphate mannosyltransferase|tara:strand:+ start:11 stop:751 length:741 start_codon:yes stop_codon:yes gene_type:complete